MFMSKPVLAPHHRQQGRGRPHGEPPELFMLTHAGAEPRGNQVKVVPILLTPRQAASALSLGQTKVYELLATGALSSIKIGTARRIPREALDRYIAARLSAAVMGGSPSLDSAP
jgi:excisionase family DNA binding protein